MNSPGPIAGPVPPEALRVCFSGGFACSGCNPCDTCLYMVRAHVLIPVLRACGLANDPQFVQAFLQAYAQTNRAFQEQLFAGVKQSQIPAMDVRAVLQAVQHFAAMAQAAPTEPPHPTTTSGESSGPTMPFDLSPAPNLPTEAPVAGVTSPSPVPPSSEPSMPVLLPSPLTVDDVLAIAIPVTNPGVPMANVMDVPESMMADFASLNGHRG